MTTKRGGRMSKKEWEYIDANAGQKDSEIIAKDLNRTVATIDQYIKKMGIAEKQVEYDLKQKPCWKELRTQFTPDELETFLSQWKQMIGQFRRDVLPTEEMQIIDTIKLEVLMNRALREQMDIIKSLKVIETILETEEALDPEIRDRELCSSLNKQVASLRSAKVAIATDYKDLQTKKAAMFKDLKATRAARVQKLENNKQTFSGLIRQLMTDPDFFEEQGHQMELLREAAASAKRQMGSLHKYADGMIDRPLLSCDTVGDGDD